jgi:hypothetical protein
MSAWIPKQKRKLTTEPKVGIFFICDGRLFIDTTPVSKAEEYGDFKVHAASRPAFWRILQANGIVPNDVEYDEVPRTRRPRHQGTEVLCPG